MNILNEPKKPATRLSFHSYKDYKECPYRYYLKHVLRQKPIKPADSYNAIFGTVFQKIFENFYNQEIWRKGSECRTILRDMAGPVLRKEMTHRAYIDWRSHNDSPENMIDTVQNLIEPNIEVIKKYNLLSPTARAEVNCPVRIRGEQELSGRIDFLIPRGAEILILDGKSSAKRDKNVDDDQLFWYALSYLIKYQKLPTYIGYWFYRFPEDPLKQIPFTVETIAGLKEEILAVIGRIRGEDFKASPEEHHCFFCPYKSECPHLNNHRYSGKSILPTNGAVVEIGFDDIKIS